jgi:ribosomal protein S10
MINLELKLESVNNKILAIYTKFLLKFLHVRNIEVKVVRLPTITNRITFLKSPHVFKKAKEHFEVKKYKVVLVFNKNISYLKTFLLNRPNTIKLKLSYQKRG